MAEKLPRLGKARKRTKESIRRARKLLKKYGHKIDPAHAAEARQSLESAEAAMKTRDVVPIYDALRNLDAAVDAHFGHVRKSSTREYIESVGVAVFVALLLRAFVVEAFTIPSGSMIPTLAVGDFLFVNKLAYGVRLPFTTTALAQWSIPERGDVIVFVYPCDDSLDYIKRVVGLPGDIISVDPYGKGFVRVNGDLVVEEDLGPFTEFGDFSDQPQRCVKHRYLSHMGDQDVGTLHCDAVQTAVPEDLSPPADWSNHAQKRQCPSAEGRYAEPFPWKVPEGYVYVMGDNRENSADSRFWGFVPMGAIKGKALFLWMSWDGTKSWSTPWEKIRWDRLFRGVHRDVEK